MTSDRTNRTRSARCLGTLLAALTLGMVGCGSSTSTTLKQDLDAGADVQHAKHDAATSHDSGHEKHDATEDVAKQHDAAVTHDAAHCPDASLVDGAMVLNCTGLCGPLTDPCTGSVTECGGCANVINDAGVSTPQACNLSTNTCGPVETTCAEFGAQCGTVVDSCGDFLDCPDGNPKGCPAGQQCNVETNQCETCQQVTCLDLGYECGFAWLGCGPNIESNFTDCGTCSGTSVCNSVFDICEPNCVPGTAASLCAAAGAQCGIITNGCGGTVDCDTVMGLGCPAGQGCGLQGVDNQCAPAVTPTQCITLGLNCGTITSQCTGQPIQCGQCPTGQVCNANNVCGAPCTPKTCAEISDLECGTFDDGCGGHVVCGTCEGGICNESTNTCCAPETCASNYSGKCGSLLANGCGSNSVTCPCPGTEVCTQTGGATPPPASGTTGDCCTPLTASSYSSHGQCGTDLPNGCDQNVLNVACGANQDCVNNSTGSPGNPPPAGTVGSCCTRTDACPAPGSDTCTQVTNSCTSAKYTCNECTAPNTCNNFTCCQGAPACTGGGGAGGECNITLQPVNPGCGNARVCNCNGSNVCWCTNHVCGGADPAGVCTAPLNCNSAGYSGHCGTGLTNGVGGTINCPCGNGEMCSTSVAGTVGTCSCDNGLGAPYTCANVPGGPGQPGGAACGSFNNGCGGTLTCNCTGGETCNTHVTPAVCCEPATCPAMPGIGTACGAVSNGCTTVQCSCPTGAGNENFMCTAGICQCTPETCMGRAGAVPDGCGGTIMCGT